MAVAHPKHALPVGHQIGGYAIVGVIGQGGFGIVYEAYNSDTEQRVAIKEYYPSSLASRQDNTIILNSEGDRDVYEKVLSRYRSTALLQLKFDHPNILKIYDYVRGINTGYMITEFVEGKSLSGVWGRHGGRVPSYDLFRNMFEPVIGALAYLHGKGFLHRDIAPDNIMWTKSGRPVLIDFGALKEDVSAASRMSSVVVVKDAYSPPEQQVPDGARPMGFYTDIYALAGTMYTALAGVPPARAMARALTQGPDLYAPIAKVSRVKAPDAVYEAIDKALEIPIQRRPKDMEEFSRLLGWDVKETKISYPDKLSAEMTRPHVLADGMAARRSKNAILAIAAMLIAAIGIGSFFFYQSTSRAPKIDQAAVAEQQQFDAAKGNIERLRAYVRECKTCAFRNEANAAVAALEKAAAETAERNTYNAARGNRDALSAYLRTCKICESQQAASAEIAELERKQLADAETHQFQKAAKDAAALRGYLTNCKLCQHKADAENALLALAKVDSPAKVEPTPVVAPSAAPVLPPSQAPQIIGKDGVYAATFSVDRIQAYNPAQPPNCIAGGTYPAEFRVGGQTVSFSRDGYRTSYKIAADGTFNIEGPVQLQFKGKAISQYVKLEGRIKDGEIAGQGFNRGARGICFTSFKGARTAALAPPSASPIDGRYIGKGNIFRITNIDQAQPVRNCAIGDEFPVVFEIKGNRIRVIRRADDFAGEIKPDGTFNIEGSRLTEFQGTKFTMLSKYSGRVTAKGVEAEFSGSGPRGACHGKLVAVRS